MDEESSNQFTRLRALYNYSYTDDDGRQVSIAEGDEYILLRKTCPEWWHVLKWNERLPFYVPANYVEVTYTPKSKSTDGSDDESETSDDGVLSPTTTLPDLPEKRREKLSRSKTLEHAKTRSMDFTDKFRTLPDTGRKGPFDDGNLASQLAEEARKMKRASFMPKSGAGSSLPPPSDHSVDYVNLGEYQKAAGIGVHATTTGCGAVNSAGSGAAPVDDSSSVYANLTTIQESIFSSQAPPKPGPKCQPTKVISADWSMYIDETSLRIYYYNSVTGESSWKPPRIGGGNRRSNSEPCDGRVKVEDEQKDEDDYGRIDIGRNGVFETGASKSSDDSLNSSREECEADGSDSDVPKGYTTELGENGEMVYVNPETNEKWHSSVDSNGKRYFYQDGSGESVWALPEVENSPAQVITVRAIKEVEEVRRMVAQRCASDRHLRAKSMMATLSDTHFTPGSHRNLATVNKRSPVAATDTNSTPPERRGLVNKTKIIDGGKRVNKKWAQNYLVLSGPTLLFYKDQKQSIAKSGKPDIVIDLCGAEIDWASKDVTSRKNVVQISSGSSVYLLQWEDGLKAHEWDVALRQSHDFSKQLVSDLPSWELNKPPPKQTPPAVNKFKRSKSAKVFQKAVAEESPSRSTIRERLLNFFLRRPPMEVLQEQGIIKNSVFGAHLRDICDRESRTIPQFVIQCIEAIEAKGLKTDGIYRLSGNLAQVQKLRFVVDQNEPYDLMGPDWDLHVLTGALKLFFRELKEPVFPFQFYEQFCRASTIRDEAKKRDAIRDLISVLPKSNFDTLKLLFRHLNTVIQHASTNRMQLQSIAIVFGPTLMWPESENANMAVNTVIQNQIIELILQNTTVMFPS